MFEYHQKWFQYLLEDDILLTSYPRSGNTWLRYLLSDIIQQVNGLETDTDLPIHPIKVIPDLYQVNSAKELSSHDLILIKRIFKTHIFYSSSISQKIIYLFRNPFDALCSYYYFHQRYDTLKAKTEGGIDAFCIQHLQDYVEHVRGYIHAKLLRQNNLHLVSYENLHLKSVQTLESLLFFCDISSCKKKCQKAVSNHEFVKHQQREKVQELGYNINFFRRGESGVAKGELRLETIQKIEKQALPLYEVLKSLESEQMRYSQQDDTSGDRSMLSPWHVQSKWHVVSTSEKVSQSEYMNMPSGNPLPSKLLSLEQTLREQENLTELCGDRPNETSEYFEANNFYGMASILQSYAGFSQDSVLNAVVPHGINLSDTFVWEAEVKAPVPAIFYHSRHVKHSYAKAIQEHGIHKFLIPCASPFLYVVEQLKSLPRPERKGTIFFPAHSTHHIIAEMDYEALAEKLENLPEEFQPVTICLYWKDYNLGREKPFKDRGMNIVSAGHMYDPLFLYRFYHLCSRHQYASSNEIGSHLFYSVKAGCSYFYFDEIKSFYTVNHNVPVSSGGETLVDELKNMFRDPQVSMSEAQMSLVDYHLGIQYLRTPTSLYNQLKQLDTAYTMLFEMQDFQTIEDSDILETIEEIPSETALVERCFLYKFFSEYWDGTGDICEIGPFLGGTTRSIALGMLNNPFREEDSTLYTFDRFKDYYDSDRLIEYLHPVLDNEVISEEFLSTLKNSTSFLDVFQALHQNQCYSSLIVPCDRPLPDEKKDISGDTNLFSLPLGKKIGAIFVDGCKSWYGTKYFMQKVCPQTIEGAVFIFQDYCWYTCFWLPVFLKRLEHYFHPIAYVGGTTFIFQLIESLDAETIDHLFPDEPEDLDEVIFHKIFAQLLLKSNTLNQYFHAFVYTLQYAASLSYLGCDEQSRSLFLCLATQPWVKPYQSLLEAAMCYPTYRPNGSISLFSQQEVNEILTQAKRFEYPDSEPVKTQRQVDLLQQETHNLQQASQQLQQENQHYVEQSKLLHDQLVTVQQENDALIHKFELIQVQFMETQEELNRKKIKIKELRERHKRIRENLKQRLGKIQEESQDIAIQLSDFKNSKFFKIREIWTLLKDIVRR